MAPWLDDSAEAVLVQGLRRRDERVVEELVHDFMPRLKAVALLNGLQKQDAESLALAALEKAVRAIDSFAERPGATFRSWVFQIMANRVIDFTRERNRERERERSIEGLGQAEPAEAGDLPEAGKTIVDPALDVPGTNDEPGGVSSLAPVTTALLDRMSPRQRQVMICTANGMTDREIAADVGITEIAVRVTRMRARRLAMSLLPEILPTLDETVHRRLCKFLSMHHDHAPIA